MMKPEKLSRLSAILLLSLLSASVLSSCGGETAQETPSDSGTAGTEAVTETETDTLYRPNVPANDFGGAEFRTVGCDPSAFPSFLLEFDFDEETGDIVQDAIFQRNRKIEEDYNITFVTEYRPQYNSAREILHQNVMADDSTFQLAMLICREAFPDSLSGYVMPYSEIPYLDFSQPWYMHDINEKMSVGDKMILAYSDESLNTYMQTICTFFNKQLISDNDFDSPYDLVRDGKWTLDTMYSMASEVIRDVNGDTRFDENDIFGISGEHDTFYPAMWIGAESALINKGADGIPVHTAPGDEKLLSILERLSEWSSAPGLFHDSFKMANVNRDSERIRSTNLFKQNQVLFYVNFVGNISLMRDMEVDFGILPLPKYDEAQENYYSRMIDGWIHVVPNTTQNLELVGTVMEALGAETRNFVIPAYFDIALTDKYARDADSEEMLNIVFNNVRVDLGDTVWFDQLRSKMTPMLENGQSVNASYLESLTNVINTAIDTALSADK